MYKYFFKRIIDFFGSLTLIIFLLPVYLLLWILIRINMGSPVVFKQDRPGRNEKIFQVLKFRSMSDKRDSDGNLLPDKDRITPLGKFLRKTSLDEIPQFFNVLKGDMTLVGPRPPLPREVKFYTDYQKLRLLVTPGLTCTWQISKNRNDIPFQQWVEMDIEYIQTRTYLNDLKIMLKTPIVMLTATGR